jgi:hypothetical protein
MKYKILIGSALAASLLVAGTAFAREGGDGGDGPELGANANVSANEDAPAVGNVQMGVRTEAEGRVPRPQDLGKQNDQEGEQQSASGTEDRAKSGEMERNKEQNREEERNASSSDSEMNKEREQNREVERNASSSEEDNATSTEGERMREQHRSEVAKAVEELLSVAERDGGIGEEVRTIAKAQEENHTKINESLKKVEARSPIAKFFIGPDQTEIDSAKQIVAANEAQIQQLTALKTKLASSSDQTVIDSLIQLLQKVNAEASTSLSQSEQGFSLFGWMFRLFGR